MKLKWVASRAGAAFVIILSALFLTAVSYAAERAVKVKPKKNTGYAAVQHDTKYHALIIGSNNYKHLPKLKTAIADAKAVEEILRTKYGFKTKLLIDATREDILNGMNDLRKGLGENDNLLIYYAGHGEFDKTADKAYWIPVNAERDNPTNWIIADDITSNIKRITSKHILIVSDSCYSGTLTRAVSGDLSKSGERNEFIKKMMEKPSRTLMASGGNEPVTDSGGGGHSVFASAFLKALRETEKNVFTAEELFHGRGSVKEMVAGKSDQVPEYNTIKNSGHDGGDFVFQLAKAAVPGGHSAPLVPVEINKPSDSDFKIDDLEKEAKEIEKNKAAWQTKLGEMKQAYSKVKTFEQGTSPADRKSSAWQRFIETFGQDNPYSQEDDTMRQEAEERISYWNSQQQTAMAPAKKFLDKITGKTLKDPHTGMEFVFVKGGCYQMGESYNAHEVCVDDFYIGKYEVTQGQWKAVMGNNPSSFSSCGDNCPVEQVSWNDAQEFIQRLNQKTKNNPQPPFSKGEFRLPTEAEWEYAARSGGKSEKYSGTSSESELGDYAWYDKNSGSKTHPVGQKKPNGLGIYDMSGNVWEWVSDWYDSDYYKNSPKNNPTGPSSGKEKVLRGGSWFFLTWVLVAAARFWYEPATRFIYVGFRLVLPVR